MKDILKFCTTNEQNLLGGLAILQSIVFEYDDLIISEEIRRKSIEKIFES